eukprot:CAMPEP_0117057156 /NCGR_PEP_ID=MMETSP0472-20121206/39666_1 /TAXON_ID=693140 ORGANISM="Tiarina fusus, Strain LIS" /NCGR_SAMPLE_ID=MMETSP0472 /ASSEMBLY_ACC=CAM_ASM_000603 /LENGTH=530 /DNA_ID=CAMNT_0004773903 /DNA_START=69 /DNA_END=1661 /DNA_ORIENTATION=+
MISTCTPSNDEPMNQQMSAEAHREMQEREERVASLKARLREWEGELQRKKNALSSSERKIVDPIFKGKEQESSNTLDYEEDNNELDIETEVFVEYDVPVGEGSTNNIRGEGHSSSDEPTIDLQLAEQELGSGPMRFSRKGERSLQEQLESLSEPNRQTYRLLVKKWNDRARLGGGFPLTNDSILRFARNNCTYSKTDTGHNLIFQERKAWKAMRKFKKRFWKLTAAELEDQLRTKTLFPVPGLKTAEGYDMFYMKPARYFPKETSARTIINNLAYVMTTMLESKEASCRDGIGFVANMDDWAMKNFDVNYCFQYMMCLQGFMVPVKVELFLIVNPPSWFGAIWKIMKPMLAPTFRRKVKVILADKLPKYLQEGFEAYLPDDMEHGKADTDAIIEDFITFRKYFEQKTGKHKEKRDDCNESCSAGSMTGSSSSGLSFDTLDTGDGSNDIPKMISATPNPPGSIEDEMHSSLGWGDAFSPKVAIRKSRDSFPEDLMEGTGWSDHLKAEQRDTVDEDDASIDEDLSIFGDVGW